MLKEIENILNLQFDHKIINFSIFVAEDVPQIISYDYKRLKQILLNLVYNAMKYTEKGYVSVIIDCKFVAKLQKFKLSKAGYKGK